MLRFLALLSLLNAPVTVGQAQRAVAFTFDDLPVSRFTTVSDVEAIHTRLRAHLRQLQIPATGFVNEIKLAVTDSMPNPLIALLEAWLDDGLELGNHTYSHLRLFDVPLDRFQTDVLRGERVTRRLLAARAQRPRYFRHPTLNTGPDLKTKEAFEQFLGARGYTVAPVTVDNDEYLRYMEATFHFYEELSRTVLGREPAQILLLHANALNADYTARLAALVVARGYRFVSLERALEDPAYTMPDTYIGARGPSWLMRWASTRGHPLAEPPAVPDWVRAIPP